MIKLLLERLPYAEQRYLLGVTGPPAAGKSTVATKIVEIVGSKAAVKVPMDGFHLSNEALKEQGLLHLKGIPDTFDGEGFVALLRRIRQAQKGETVYAPAFDRSIESTFPDAIEIRPSHNLIVVEGNYLLFDEQPWREIRELLDQVWYIDVDKRVANIRLLERHMAGGKTEEQARAKIASTDGPNAELIAKTRHLADVILGQDEI